MKVAVTVLLSALALVAVPREIEAEGENQPPVACFTLNPVRGTIDTVFVVDATCSTDDTTPAAKIKVRWDWENDGIWDTPLTNVRTATHSYSHEGVYAIRLEVRDQQGLSGTTTRPVVVLPSLAQILVGEPPEMPGATEPDVAVDPDDPRRIVVAAITARFARGESVPYPAFYSEDGGASWARSQGLPPSHSTDPQIRVDGDGDFILSTLDGTTRDGTPQGIVVSRSSDGGRTFPISTYAMDPSTRFSFPDGSTHTLCAEEGSFFDFPRLAVDRGAASPHRNNLYLLAGGINFDLNGDGGCEAASTVFIRSVDGGFTWESGQVVAGMKQYTGSIGIAPDGTIYISDPTIHTPFCPGEEGIALRRSVDGGASFLPATCAWAARGTFRPGLTWTTVDPEDSARIYIAFEAMVADLGASDHVYVIRSADAGATWSAPSRIDDVLSDDAVDHLRPSLSVSTSGRLDLAWMDYRNSTPRRQTANRQRGDVYYSYSLDQGGSWAPNIRLSEKTAPLAFGGGNDSLAVASSEHQAHAVFAQDEDGNGLYETYLTTLTFH